MQTWRDMLWMFLNAFNFDDTLSLNEKKRNTICEISAGKCNLQGWSWALLRMPWMTFRHNAVQESWGVFFLLVCNILSANRVKYFSSVQNSKCGVPGKSSGRNSKQNFFTKFRIYLSVFIQEYLPGYSSCPRLWVTPGQIQSHPSWRVCSNQEDPFIPRWSVILQLYRVFCFVFS